MPKKYKIKYSEGRTLGPLEIERVRLLAQKGRLTGKEPTAAEPYTSWAPLSTYPELAELILDGLAPNLKSKEGTGTISAQATKTILSHERGGAPDSSSREDEEPLLAGIPTLVNIPVPTKIDPDTEKTMLHIPAPEPTPEQEGTKIIQTESMDLILKELTTEPAPAEEAPKPKGIIQALKLPKQTYVIEDGKKRLISRNSAALLAMAIMAMAYFTMQEENSKDPANIVPRYHTFPYVEVNSPPPLGNVADLALSVNLADQGSALIEKETPSAYITAIKKYFYPAVGKNPMNHDAKALLATSYMRISEIVPRDQRFFETVEKLIYPGPPASQWSPEYTTARAEYLVMLNRLDQAQETVDTYLKNRPTPELLYQKARVAYERRDLDTALTSVSKSIPPENVKKANPRHLLLYISLLDEKGQKASALQALKRLVKESPGYGPGQLYNAETLYKSGKHQQALEVLKALLQRPYLFTRTQLADTFLLTAKVFEGLNQPGDMKRAQLFAETALKNHYNKDLVEGIYYRIRSKLPEYKKAYELLLSARQKEKSKQTDLAINAYVSAIEENRKDPIPYLLLARVYEEKGDIYEALDRYKKALDTPKRPIEAALDLARIYVERHEIENAKNMLTQAKTMKRNRDQISFLQGQIHLKARQPELAEAMFEDALKKGSRYPLLYIQMGKIATEKANQKLAEFYYSVALRYEPLNPKAMLGVALTRFYLDSPSRAISFLKDKLALQPNSAAIMTNLAAIYLQSGDQDSGKNYLTNAIRSDPRYAEAFRLLGDLTKKSGDRQNDNLKAKRDSYRYALASYEMYSKLAPNDPEGFRATGDLYFDIRDLGAAAKNYYKVLELTPNYPDVRLRLAQISRNGGDATKAMDLIQQEIKINPRNDAAYVERGNILMAKRDFPGASSSYTEAARLNEQNADALFGLGVVHHLQGSFDNALSLFARVIKLDPLKADVYFQMGLIYQKQNNRQKAIQSFTNFKGTTRDPQGVAKADEKIRELMK